MSIQVQDMAVFLAVARDGSFGRAASSLMVSQPAVSERILGVERQVGTALFTRGPRGVSLTAAGERLLPYADRLVALAEEAESTIRATAGVERFRVGVHTTFSQRAVPIVLDALGDSECALTFRDAHSEQLLVMLADGVIDVAFIWPMTAPRGIIVVRLAADPIACVVSPDHQLRGAVGVADLARDHLALNAWGTGASAFLGELRRHGAAEWRRRECADAATALRLARSHAHVALVGASAASEDVDAGALRPLRLALARPWSVPFAVAYRERDRNEPSIAALRARLGRSSARNAASKPS